MINNFRNYLCLTELVEKIGGVAVESWHQDIGKLLPRLDLGLPQVNKTGRIDVMLDKKNPIYIQLSDGTKLFLTHDEFRRIEGVPERGKIMTVTMQRLGHDKSDSPSQVVKCKVNEA